jgi:hypothetical protein
MNSSAFHAINLVRVRLPQGTFKMKLPEMNAETLSSAHWDTFPALSGRLFDSCSENRWRRRLIFFLFFFAEEYV